MMINITSNEAEILKELLENEIEIETELSKEYQIRIQQITELEDLKNKIEQRIRR